MRDITLGDTIDFKFNTCEPDTGAPITLAGTPVISAYVGNGTTEITAGITLTVDFDGRTGCHNVRVVASSGNGFATATDVALVITTGTVDAISAVGVKVAEFTIGRAQTANVTQYGGTAGTFSAGIPSVNAAQISGDATAADNLEALFDATAGAYPDFGILDRGTAQSATATTLVLRAASAFADDTIIGATLMAFGSTQGYWQTRTITDVVLSTDTVSVDTWQVTPSGTITYIIFGTAPASAASAIAANVTQWNGAAVVAPAVAGVPKVDITHIAGATVNATSAQLGVNVVQISGDGNAADNCELYFDGTGYKDPDNFYVIRNNTAQAGAIGTITLDTGANGNDDFYNSCIIQIVSGTGSGQSRFVGDYTGASKIATVSPNWIVAPDNTSVFIIWPFGSIPGATAPTTADIWTYATRRLSDATNVTSTGATIPITAGGLVSADMTAISTDSVAADRLESALDGTGGVTITATFSGNLNGNLVGNVSGSVAGSVASVTGGVGSVAGNVGGSVLGGVAGAVGSVAAVVSADVVRVNGILVDGAGTTLDPWGPA